MITRLAPIEASCHAARKAGIGKVKVRKPLAPNC